MARIRRMLVVLLIVMVGTSLMPGVSNVNIQTVKAASAKASDDIKTEVYEYQNGDQSGEQMHDDITGIIKNYNWSDSISLEEFETSYDYYVLSKKNYLEAMGSCINALNDTINIFGQLENAPDNPNYTVQDMENDLKKLREYFDDYYKKSNLSADAFAKLFAEICAKLEQHYQNMQTGCDNYKAQLDEAYLAYQSAREAYLKAADAIVTTALIAEETENQSSGQFGTIDISKASVSVNAQTFTGKELKPKVTVKTGNGTELKQDRDYTVAYSNNIYPGMGTVTVTGKGNYTGSKTATFRIQFNDVTNPDDFWYTPVYWAFDNHITTGFLVNGKSDGTFRPWNTCNRAAVVTFLWRLAGSPPPKAMASFKDMTGNGDFDKAISWGSANGILTGYIDNTFRPWNDCNRAATVTFLYRYDRKFN